MSMQLSSRSIRFGIAAAALGLVAGSAAAVSAAGGGGGAARDGSGGPSGLIHEQLSGYEEAPLALSTAGHGTFRAMVTDDGIEYELTYADTVGTVSQAHIHFGAVGQAGGISVFLCTNLGNGPAGTPTCPTPGGTVEGTLGPADVVGPAGQGIAPGEFDELVDAIEAGYTYANVHSQARPAGEIRAQLEHGPVTD
jgi:hypothetical protein